jgi:hypothetical protein
MCHWQFANTADLTADVAAFFQGNAQVDPREYFPRVTEFKREMYKDRPQV